MIWIELYDRVLDKLSSENLFCFPAELLSKNEIDEFHNIDLAENIEQVVTFFSNNRYSLFLKALVNTCKFVPDCLMPTMIRNGVLCDNPSFNKHYLIEPFKKNSKLVFYELLNYIKHGTEEEVAGSYSVLYWYKSFNESYSEFSFEINNENKQDLIDLALKHFANSNNISVLRNTVHFINYSKEAFSIEYQNMFDSAFEKAKNHKDLYIQNRYHLALGETEVFQPITN